MRVKGVCTLDTDSNVSPESVVVPRHHGLVITWLVHVVGEADLRLASQARQGTGRDDVLMSGQALDGRLQALQAAVEAGDRVLLERLLVAGSWDRGASSEPGGPPLPKALEAISADVGPGGGVRLILVATRQAVAHRLDSAATACELRKAVERFPDLLGVPVKAVDVAIAQQFSEAEVLKAIGPLLDGAVRGDRGAVTWGPGATRLALASMTSLVRARLPWVFVKVPEIGPARLVDPLENVTPDPVVALLVRWRMFRSLADLAGVDPPPIELDGPQRAVVERLAQRWERGHQEATAEALRGLVADAVVRGDGTAGFAVRRYIEARYQELRADEPGAVDLLEWAQGQPGSGRMLGQRLAYVNTARARATLPSGEADRPSCLWLVDPVVAALNDIGKRSSHELRAASPKLALKVARALAAVPEAGADAAELTRVGLPAAPVTPGPTVFAAWAVGNHSADGKPTIGKQLVDEELGTLVRDHLGIARQGSTQHRGGPRGRQSEADRCRVVNLWVLLIATPDSAAAAEVQRRELVKSPWPDLFARVNAIVEIVHEAPSSSEAQTQIENAVLDQVARISDGSKVPTGLGAVVVVPTGLKEFVLPLVGTARRESARRGVPMFLRELTGTAESGPGTHLWPALIEGDLPLLVAAREAVAELELDVAWRLLSATSVADSLAVRYRELRNAFTCAEVDDPDTWPKGLPSPVPDRVERTLGLLGERLRLVRAALAAAEKVGPSAAVRIRYLMLAAATVETTVGSACPRRDAGTRFMCLQKELHRLATEKRRRSQPDDERVLLVLNAARNDIPITHGRQSDPDAAVRAAVQTVAAETAAFDPSARARLADVPSLIEAAAEAADHLFTPAPGAPGILTGLYESLGCELSYEIKDRDHSQRGPGHPV